MDQARRFIVGLGLCQREGAAHLEYMRQTFAKIAGSVLFVSLLGCSLRPGRVATPEGRGATAEQGPAFTSDEWRRSLEVLEETYENDWQATGLALANRATNRSAKEAALVMQIQLDGRLNRAMEASDPLVALANTWTLAHRVSQYLEGTGEGATLFGDNQTEAQAMAGRMLEAARDVATELMGAAAASSLEDKTRKAAAKEPMRGIFQDASAANVRKRESTWTGLGTEFLNAGYSLTMAPVSAVQSLGQGATGLLDSTSSLRRISESVDDFPRKTRLEMSLLASEVLDHDAVTSAILALDRTSLATTQAAGAAERLTAATERLPKDLTSIVEATGAQQDALQKTLTEARVLIEAARPLIEEAAATTRGLAEAGTAWTEAMRQLNLLVHGDGQDERAVSEPDGTNHRPFDITEYQRTADSLAVAARELREMLAATQALMTEPKLDSASKAAMGEAASMIDRIAWRLGILAGLVALLVAGLMVLRNRLAGVR